MPKTASVLKPVFAAALALVLLVAVIFGAIWVSHIESNRAAGAYPRCVRKQQTHLMTIQNDKVTPAHTNAVRCDILTITNLDNKPRIIGFGPHDHHIAYDGVSERYLSEQGGTLSVTLVQPGTFAFHDHIQREVRAAVTVVR